MSVRLAGCTQGYASFVARSRHLKLLDGMLIAIGLLGVLLVVGYSIAGDTRRVVSIVWGLAVLVALGVFAHNLQKRYDARRSASGS
jgi:hypothetical protein